MRQFGGASLLSLVNAVTSGLAALVVARLLGASGFGEYAYVMSIASFASLVFGLGTGITLRLRSARGAEPQDERAYGTFTWGAAIVTGGVVSATVLLAPPGDGRASWPFVLAVFAFAALLLASRQAMEATQARGALLKSILSSAIASIVLALAAIAATGQLDDVPASVALALASLGLVSQLAFLGLSRPRVILRGGVRHIKPAAALAREGWKGMGFNVGLSAIQRSPRVLIVALLGPTTGGVYVVASTLAESSRLVSGSMGQVLFLKVSGGAIGASETKRLRRISVGVNVMIALVVGMVGGPFIDIGFGHEFSEASDILWILLFAEVFLGMSIVDARVALGRGYVSKVAAGSIAVALGSTVTILVGAMLYELHGALTATVFSYVLFAMVMRRIAINSEA